MSFYSRVIFPRLCDFFLNRPFIADLRRDVLARARGDVLEIGFGTGLNLPYYPNHVDRIVTVDPNVGMHRRAQARIAATTVDVAEHTSRSERLPFADETFDCVVSTFTLCSVMDVEQSMRELFRVLKPAGEFLFLEHGESPDISVRKWQHRLNWLEMRLGDGCHLDRNIKRVVSEPEFASLSISQFYLERVPRTHGFVSKGHATK